jgi:hypothetical protein
MPDDADLEKLKRSISPQILAIAGVSGIGVGENILRIYLERDDANARAAVEQLIRGKGSGVPIEFRVIGKLRALSEDSRDSSLDHE